MGRHLNTKKKEHNDDLEEAAAVSIKKMVLKLAFIHFNQWKVDYTNIVTVSSGDCR